MMVAWCQRHAMAPSSGLTRKWVQIGMSACNAAQHAVDWPVDLLMSILSKPEIQHRLATALPGVALL